MKIKGIDRNIKPEDLSEGYSLNNKNLVYSKLFNCLINENGFLVHQKKGSLVDNKYGLITIPIGLSTYYLKPMGSVPLDNSTVLVFSCGFNTLKTISNIDTGVIFSDIGIIDKDGFYTSIIRDIVNGVAYTNNNRLNFDPTSPITGQYAYNDKGELLVAFCDGDRNNPRLINITRYINNPITNINPFQINDITLFQDKSDVNISININNNGGNLISGSYYPFFKYKNQDGSSTNYGVSKNPIIIFRDSYEGGANYNSSQGSPPNTRTSKSVTITITDIDTTFDFIVLSVIKVINNIITAEEVNQIPIIGNTLTYIYTGLESVTSFGDQTDAILLPTTVYSRIGKFAQVSKRLYAIKPKELDFDYQPFANNIKLRWKSKLISPYINGSKNQDERFKTKSFQHREVYGANIHLILEGGIITRGFHIPGIEPDFGQKQISSLAQSQGLSAKNYQIDDTCTITTNNPTGESTGLCSVWENENEEYPDLPAFDILNVDGSGNPVNIGTLRNKNVRHHKMPSLNYMKTNLYSDSAISYGNAKMDCLGIEAIDVKFPKEIASKIRGWFLSFPERTGANNTIIGQSLMLSAASTSGAPAHSYGSNGVNCFSYQCNGSDSNFNNNSVFRFYDALLLRNRLSVGGAYVMQELRITRDATLVYANYNNTISNAQGYLVHLATAPGNTCTASDTTNRIRKISGNAYVNANVITSINVNTNNYTFDNRFLEECLELVLGSPMEINSDVTSTGRYDLEGDNLDGKPLLYYLSNLCILNKNPYFQFFTQQKLVNTGDIFQGTINTGKTYGGDTYVTVNSINTLGWGTTQTDIADVQYTGADGLRTNHFYTCESIIPLDLRYVPDSNNSGDKYFPNYDIQYLSSINNRNSDLPYHWDASILRINDITPLFVSNPYNTYNSNLDFRIPRSAPFESEGQNSNWRIWLINDYYTVNRNKGAVTNIQGADRNLYIQTTQATYITTGNEQMDVDGARAFIGSGDIFTKEPIEILPSEQGTIGNQNMLASVLTEVGFITIDRERGKVWLISGSSAANIGKGLEFFFKDNLNYITQYPGIQFQEDNPYSWFGYTIAYDVYVNRIIISKKAYDLTTLGELYFRRSDSNYPHLRYEQGRIIYYQSAGIKSVIELGDPLYFINKCFTYSYSFITEEWISEHDYTPDFLISTRKLLLSFKDNYIFKHNDPSNKCIYYNTSIKDIDHESDPQTATPFPSYIIPVFNFGKKETKLFTDVEWTAKIFDKLNYQQQLTFSKILAWNDFQTTDDIDLVNYEFADFNTNTRNVKQTWHFNKLRDLLRVNYLTTETEPFIKNYLLNPDTSPIDATKSFENKVHLIEKYLAIKLLYNNEIITNLQNEIQIFDVSCDAVIVNR